MRRKASRVSCQRCKYHLAHIGGAVFIAVQSADGGGIHQRKMAADKFSECLFRAVDGVSVKQDGIVGHARSSISGTESKTGQEICDASRRRV
jgi:hypothetical protein